MSAIGQDLRYATRIFRKSPGFTLVAVMTLALGIGGTTALFSIVNAAILRRLPYPAADRLMVLRETIGKDGIGSVAYPNYLDWKAQDQDFEDLAAYAASIYNLQTENRTDRIAAELVTGNYFSILGAKAVLGRLMSPEDTATINANPVAVISYGLWQRRFGGDPGIIGRTVRINEAPFVVIGVVSRDFVAISGTAEVWAPITMHATLFPQTARFDFVRNRDTHWHRVIGRLKPGITLEQARTEMRAIGDRLAQAYPKENQGRSAGVFRATDVLQGSLRTPLWLLLGAVSFVLLIACANIANLLLTRLAARNREIAVRSALGAGRFRIAQQLFTESFLLAAAGGVTGVALAAVGKQALLSWLPLQLPPFAHVRLDLPVLVASLLITLVTAVLVGLAPMRGASNLATVEVLRTGGRALGGRHARRVAALLATSQIALALILMCGAGLLIRTLWAMQSVDLGFRPDHLAVMRFDVPNLRYTGDERLTVGQRLTDRVKGLPGVESAAVTMIDPFLWSGINRGFTIQGRPETRGDQVEIYYQETGPGFFHTMGIPMVAGRDFSEHDSKDAPPVVIVSQAFARRFWPGENAVGKQMRLGGSDSHYPWMTVVGVAGDFRFDSLTQDMDTTAFYAPLLQSEVIIGLDLVVRTRNAPAGILTDLEKETERFDAGIPVYNLATMEERLSSQTASTRGLALLLGLFGGTALLLACIGVYGVIASAVSQRTPEMAIRMAIGAQPRDILLLVLRGGVAVVAPGLVVGLGGAASLSRFMTGLLYGVAPSDWLALSSATVLLLTVALAATWFPARRAAGVQPMVALREE